MNIKIICVGKIKERFFSEAVDEYSKRLSRYARITITEVKDESVKESLTVREKEKILITEGERILERIDERDHVTALAIRGRKLDSEGFADYIRDYMLHSRGSLCFVIGGSVGLSKTVEKRADELLSFSDMTFPHQLMRVILMEQIYRGFRIINNEPYHK